MIETLFNANGDDITRIRRAFGWVVTFREFPIGSFQTVDGDSMMSEALTLFTKGRAEFHLDGVQRADRVPGTLSSEHEIVGQGGTFKIVYTERTSRVCIPIKINRMRMPNVRKVMLNEGDSFEANGRFLVCLGSVQIAGKTFEEERTFDSRSAKTCTALSPVILLEFLN